ncbi:MAG: HAMP domain-containing histidine kinase [Kiritimatiellae bacterium]|nr:HAMP domain-containing histidine kinase [Kiritimatiellia bacterium]
MHLLRHERERWEAQAEAAEERMAAQAAEDIHDGLETLRDEFARLLGRLSEADPGEALYLLGETHPLVRNVFWVRADGDRMLPPSGMGIDPETERFLHRYGALFEGRVEWLSPIVDEPSMLEPRRSPRQVALRGFEYGKGADFGKDLQPKSSAEALNWRAWHWEDGDALLAYVRREPRGDIIGIELEMSALYARLDVLLRALSEGGAPMALLDRADRMLLTTGEVPESVPVTLEVGPMLPFARLAVYPRTSSPTVSGNLFYLFAAGAGLFLLLSISATGLGLTAWLNRSRREALRKTTFVSNVSHEFKTPLTTLRLYSEMLLEGRVKDPEKQTRYLQTMRDESDRLARLVYNVLDFSRLEMRRKSLRAEALDLGPLLQKVTEALGERFRGAGIRVNLPEAELPALCDADAAEQIMLNLFDNALKYAPQTETLEVSVEESPRFLRLCFRDFGPGIPPKHRKHLFKAFHQVDERLTRESGGTGLGLHLARRLAREMGGDLAWVDVPKGACFVWTVPRNRQEMS